MVYPGISLEPADWEEESTNQLLHLFRAIIIVLLASLPPLLEVALLTVSSSNSALLRRPCIS